jgi:hypothetical protein
MGRARATAALSLAALSAALLLADWTGGSVGGLSRARADYRVLALKKKFIPSNFPGLLFWHDPSVAANVTTGTGGVSQIVDLTANSRNATQGTGGIRPDYTTGGISGLNAITYVNTDTLEIQSAGSIAQNIAGISFCAVVQLTSHTALNRIWYASTNTAGLVRITLQTEATTGQLQVVSRRLDSDALITSTATALALSDGSPSFVCMTLNYLSESGNVVLYKDGVAEVKSAAWASAIGNSENLSSPEVFYGRRGVNQFAGALGESLAYSRVLLPTEVDFLRIQYIKGKWGTP